MGGGRVMGYGSGAPLDNGHLNIYGFMGNRLRDCGFYHHPTPLSSRNNNI